MLIVNPKVEIITEQNPLKRIELAGRVCYKSEKKITENSAFAFVKKLLEMGHTSPLEHARITMPYQYYQGLLTQHNGEIPYGMIDRIHPAQNENTEQGISINIRDYMAIGGQIKLIQEGKFQNANGYMTVKFICDRGISHQIVRHRIFSFSQESTRYCKYKDNVVFINPLPFFNALQNSQTTTESTWWWKSCDFAEKAYHGLIFAGATPQEARNVLTNSVKTEVITTGTTKNWTEMIKTRTANNAHPQIKYLMEMLKKEYTK